MVSLDVMNSLESCRVLYIASGGIEEPLIRSQVLNYISSLAESISLMHLVTFERSEVTPFGQGLGAELRSVGMEWTPVFMKSRVPYIGRLNDLQRATQACESIVRSSGITLVHARSFLPGRIGLKLKKRFGVKFLYDMRGFWALEKRAKGSIKTNFGLSIVQRFEDQLFREADYLVSLTEACARHLQADRGFSTPSVVIPTCTDLTRFLASRTRTDPIPMSIVSCGSIGRGYLGREIFRFHKLLQNKVPKCKLRVATRTSDDLVRRAICEAQANVENVVWGPVEPREIPGVVGRADVGISFHAPGKEKIATCPTKIGEYLAKGIPVVSDPFCGDIADLIHDRKIGVIVEDFSDRGLGKAVSDLLALMLETDLALRCRETAEDMFSLEVGVAKYLSVYEQVLSNWTSNRNSS